MADSPSGGDWGTFVPAITTVVGGALTLIGKALWNKLWGPKDEQETRADDKFRRDTLRSLDTRASHELEKAWKRIDDLQANCDEERDSGLKHYTRSLRLYDLLVQALHDWRSGKAAPPETPDFDKV